MGGEKNEFLLKSREFSIKFFKDKELPSIVYYTNQYHLREIR